jgi:transcriptional regulator with PAS, ATPase and Fis domain
MSTRSRAAIAGLARIATDSILESISDGVFTGVSPDVLGVLTAHDYPGNVRELQNIVEHAFVLIGEGPIELAHLPRELVPLAPPPAGERPIVATVRALEGQAIREALARHGGNRLAAARALGMHKSTLFRKVRLPGIELPERDGRSHH